MLGYRPLVYFWIAEYTSGLALPQFDPATGKENKFSEVDQTKLKRFGWYPFTVDLAQKILTTENLVVFPAKSRSHSVSLESGNKLVAFRTNTVKMDTKHGKVDHAGTVYVLGVEGKSVLHINEEGNVISGSC